MRRKTATMGHQRIVTYEDGQWELLEDLRQMAAAVMNSLGNAGFGSYVYGSLEHGITGRKLVQATPGGLAKAHIYLPGNTMVTFPLVEPTARELDFYAFGGQLGRGILKRRCRTCRRVRLPGRWGWDRILLRRGSGY